MTIYENYYYLDNTIKIEGLLYPSEGLPKKYQLLLCFDKYGLSLKHEDPPALNFQYPHFYIRVDPEVFSRKVQRVNANILRLWQEDGDFGSVSMFNGYVAASAGSYGRTIHSYRLKLKRRKGETYFFIDGKTGLLQKNTVWNKDDIARIEELGTLSFSIWFNLRDSRIKDVFYDSTFKAAYENLIQLDAFNSFE